VIYSFPQPNTFQSIWPVGRHALQRPLLPYSSISSAHKVFGGQSFVSVPANLPQIQDHFLDPKHNISSQQALGLFLTGFVLSVAGKSMWHYLLPPTKSKKPFESRILEDTKEAVNKLTVYQNYNDSLSSIYRIVHLDPNQGNALLVYAGTCVLGYLSGSVVQGGKETWVRREETRIRAKLVNRLQEVVRQSIQNKNQFNANLKEDLRTRLLSLLQKHGIANAVELVQDVPILESPGVQRKYFYEPTHRTLQFRGSNLENLMREVGLMPESGFSPDKPPLLLNLQKGLLFGLGAFSGYVLHGFVKLLRATDHVDATTGSKSVWESIQLKDKETWSLIGIKNRKNFAIMSGFFAMSAAASIGKTLLDGLREVEVTRLNARTELDYQTHNWLAQDPAFHSIAEWEAAQNDMKLLERDLPRLKCNPPLLQQRVQAILSNVGRNSAPPYFPMTPMVGLVEARA
jgi:signal transduction histidine kinase